MGALEYLPSKSMTKRVYDTVDIQQMSEVSEVILNQKKELSEANFDHESLLNIFRIGGSAGGARPKILVSEEISTGKLVPGDANYSSAYKHYLVKLALDNQPYPQEKIEFAYYNLATRLGIEMQPSHLIEDKHFCTLRFDRKDGEKSHILTACGMTGWDFKDAQHSNYENLFKLANNLGVSQSRIEQLYRRMVFNVIYMNIDDHLKNFSFIFDHDADKWDISPAYDITYALNPMLVNKNMKRAMSINGKRSGLTHQDLVYIGEIFAIKGTKSIVKETIASTANIKAEMKINSIGEAVVNGIVANIDAHLKRFQTKG